MSTSFDVRKAVTLCILGILLGFVIGTLSGYFIARNKLVTSQNNDLIHSLSVDNWNDNPHFAKFFIENIQPNNIRENLRECAKEPHLAGTPRDEELAKFIQKTLLENGFDTAELVPYDVLLSHPDPKKRNMIEILGAKGKVQMTIVPLEHPLREGDRSKTLAQAYHAFSPNGTVEGEVVFVNENGSYDLSAWQDEHVNISGKILLVAATHSGISSFAKEAAVLGAVGILTFPYPDTYSYMDDPVNQYPKSDNFPGTGMVHATLGNGLGDALTPGIPAKPYTYRKPLENLDLPPIPSQPISYNDAKTILRLLSGKESNRPVHFNVSENEKMFIGPGFKNPKFQKLRLTTYNQMKITRIFNVIGTIQGSLEPDRYVILGNHRDAWSYGGADPCSGTSALLEISRVYGEMRKTGWRPRRTLVFGSWTAEEFGIIGSIEWVEEKLPKLRERGVSYINTDICVIGEKFFPLASPVLHEAILNVTKMIPDPKEVEANFFEAWLKQQISANKDVSDNSMPEEPKIDPRSSVLTDHVPFMRTASIPVMDINWRPTIQPFYQNYHTGYDTFHLINQFIDPTFKFHKTCGQLAGLLLLNLADSKLLPFSLRRHRKYFTEPLEKITAKLKRKLGNDQELSQSLEKVIKDFTETVENWYKELSQLDRNNPLVVRRFNDQMMQMEKVFSVIEPDKETGLDKPLIRLHFSTFLYHLRLLFDEVDSLDPIPKKKYMELKKLVSYIVFMLNYIIQVLQPFSTI